MTKEEFISKYFGELDHCETHDLVENMNPDFVCNGVYLGMINKNANLEALAAMKKGFLDFWAGYERLDPALWDFADLPDHRDFCIIYWKLMGRVPDFHSPIYGEDQIDLPNRISAFEVIQHAIEQRTDSIHHNAVKHDYPSKVACVYYANDMWERYVGKKIPKKPSPGTIYFEYLADFILVMGKNWSVQSVLRACNRQLL